MTVSHIFVDPSGRHILLTTSPASAASPMSPSFALLHPTPVSTQTTPSEMYYLHASSQRPRHVAVLKTKGGVLSLAPSAGSQQVQGGISGGSIGAVTAVAWHPGQPSDCKPFAVALAALAQVLCSVRLLRGGRLAWTDMRPVVH